MLGDTDDSIDAHVADTIAAGRRAVRPGRRRSIVADGYRRRRRMLDDGAVFDEAAPRPGRYPRGRALARRVVHSGGDATGAEVQRALVTTPRRPWISAPYHVALADSAGTGGAVTGVQVLNEDGLGSCTPRRWSSRPAASASCTQATTNPEGRPATASRWPCGPGVPISDIEFIQFHPTMLFDGNAADAVR